MEKKIETNMKVSPAKERLIIFAVFSILFVHIIACVWIYLGNYNRNEDKED